MSWTSSPASSSAKNVLQSPLDFWARYDTWREAVKGLESAIREMEEKDGNIGKDFGRD